MTIKESVSHHLPRFVAVVGIVVIIECIVTALCDSYGVSSSISMGAHLGVFVGFGGTLFRRVVAAVRDVRNAEDFTEKTSTLADDLFDEDVFGETMDGERNNDNIDDKSIKKTPRRMPKWLAFFGAIACLPPFVEAVLQATKGFFGYPPGNLLEAGILGLISGVPLVLIWWHLGRDEETKS